MKTIGLIGGMSWESTAVYYRRLNQEVRRLCGGLHSAEIILRSIDFVRIVEMQKRGAWNEAASVLRDIAVALENSGAEMILICTNTMHKVADEVQDAISVPLIHIADVTGLALKGRHCQRPLLLATQYTMEQDFYRHRLQSGFGIAALIPDTPDRAAVHNVIFDELCCGVIKVESRKLYYDIIARGIENGADSLILGCTEIGLLLNDADIGLPVFDSTLLHADAALTLSLQDFKHLAA